MVNIARIVLICLLFVSCSGKTKSKTNSRNDTFYKHGYQKQKPVVPGYNISYFSNGNSEESIKYYNNIYNKILQEDKKTDAYMRYMIEKYPNTRSLKNIRKMQNETLPEDNRLLLSGLLNKYSTTTLSNDEENLLLYIIYLSSNKTDGEKFKLIQDPVDNIAINGVDYKQTTRDFRELATIDNTFYKY